MKRSKSPDEKIAQDIAAIVRTRQIQHVLHFTPLENLPSILKLGLLSKSARALADLDVRLSDSNRMDNENDAVSVSISCYFPKMFDAKRYRSGSAPWVVLLLHPSLLWTIPCRFYARGVPTKSTKSESHRRHSGRALDKLFDECFFSLGGDGLRAKAGLPQSFPTFASAEVQVMDTIAPEFIVGAWVKNVVDGEEVTERFAAVGRHECTVNVHPFRPSVECAPYYWG